MQLIKYLAENNAVGLVEMESETSLSMAMEGTTIRSLSKILTKKDIVKSISFFIGRFNENFNASGKFTDIQLATVSMDLFDIFQYESLEDVMLMFKYARQGKIGDGKDFKLDSQTVFHKWVPQYLELKAIERENQHRKNVGEKNGLANFKWKSEDVEKLKTSSKIETIKQGFGSRLKEVIDTPEGYVPPIQKRSVYLGLLKESCKNASRTELEMGIQNLEEKATEPDAIEVMKNELKERGINI